MLHDKPSEQIYDKMMGELRPIQLKAVNWDEGPLLVLAGPGSGKTRVLTCRIARLLKATEQKAFRILGLTFTNKAADEMRDRVASMVPNLGDRLFLGTFHSFCADVLRQHGSHLSIRPDFRLYSNDSDRQEILKDAVDRLRANSDDILPSDTGMLPLIDRLKGHLISPEESEQRIADPTLRAKAGRVYESYEAELRARNALDFNSLVYYTCQLFRQYPTFAKRYRTVYPYWCVDEFQDTNLAQYELLNLMATPDFRNIFVVADDDQIIYQWNGASHKRIETFQNAFSAEVIQLPTNYRCPPEIVELANDLIKNNMLRHSSKEPLDAAKQPSASRTDVLRLLHFHSQNAEAEGVAEDIAENHCAALSQVVVLGRTKRLLEGVTAKLTAKKIKAVISQRRDEFLSAQFTWLHCGLRQANNRHDLKNFVFLCEAFSFLSGMSIDCDSLVASARTKHGDYLREWADYLKRESSNDDIRRVAAEVMSTLVQGSDYRGFVRYAIPWLDSTVNKENSGGDQQADTDYDDDKRAWNDIYHQVTSVLGTDATLDSFLHELEMRSKEPPITSNTVALMTIHAAKGKEFDFVYLIGLAEDVLPSFQSKKKGDKSVELEEERRNCFVALTRTKEILTLSYADAYYGYSKAPSRFLCEMGINPVTG